MNRSLIMSQKELQRIPVLEGVLARRLTQIEAAEVLTLSVRQVFRLKERFKQSGPEGLAHKNRSRPSNHRYPESLRNQALQLIQERYSDFGPTLASEKLSEIHKISLSDETLRLWMRKEGFLAGTRRKRPHREWRERSACLGAMVQMDGSHHDWLEGRGNRLVLMGYSDDATGRVFARFYPSEDLSAALDSFKRYSKHYGLPQSVYLDKHTIYRSPKTPTLQDQLEGKTPQSQFERALSELAVSVIHANSPQAKGRIERLFLTFQDRVIKEMRLANIRTLEEANDFLKRYLPIYNRRFARAARQAGDLHRKTPLKALESALCIKETRTVTNDSTIQINNQRLQLTTKNSLASKKVTVTINPQGRMQVLHHAVSLPYRALTSTPKPTQPEPMPRPKPKRKPWSAHKPNPGHPWKQYEQTKRLKELKNRTFLNWQKPDISILV